MISKDKYYGGADELNLDATAYRLVRGSKRFQGVTNFSGASAQILLPDATTMDLGGIAFVIANFDNAKNLYVKDDGGTTLETLVKSVDGYAVAMISLVNKDDANGTWIIKVVRNP